MRCAPTFSLLTSNQITIANDVDRSSATPSNPFKNLCALGVLGGSLCQNKKPPSGLRVLRVSVVNLKYSLVAEVALALYAE
jgi:hypothetical protein